MYIGVDVGGTKTLVAVLDDRGVIQEKTLFPTPETYAQFLKELEKCRQAFKTKDYQAGAVGITGRIDRKHGRRHAVGKLAWENIPVQADAERILDCPIVIENDAKLAGLSEAMLLKDDYSRVLYVTVSTGIGFAFVVDGIIDISIGDRGGTTIMIAHQDKHAAWESVVSGRAIVKRFGKKAAEITDTETWQTIARDLSKGMLELIAVTEPEVIVIGGGVGTYFDRFHKSLEAELDKHKLPSIKMPVLRQAQRPEEAVVYGCYDLAKQVYGNG